MLCDAVHSATAGKAHQHGVVDDLFIEDRQRTRHSDADGAALGIDGCAVLRGAGAEDFGLCVELGMHFNADYRFVHVDTPLQLGADPADAGGLLI
ncbi:hypothetical protein SDC9_102160 [bioreactor metagenome]|uniref:Uncharacterized protein n=1 Tax=bioreactor metagenome TaxID=1076179 RepID=A0A645AQ24_9ZZZZ